MAERKPSPDPIPFDEALRRMLNTPPQHKPAKKAPAKKKAKR